MKGVTGLRKFWMGLLSLLLVLTMVQIGTAAEPKGEDVDLWNVVKPLETTVTL